MIIVCTVCARAIGVARTPCVFTDRSLLLDSNSLTGSIPSYLSVMPNLDSLNLAGNALSGSVPTSLWQLTALRYHHELP